MGEEDIASAAVRRRSPAVGKDITAISPAIDRRVRIEGKIEKKGLNGALTVSDGTGKTEVFFDNLDLVDSIEKTYSEGEKVTVVGLVVPQDGGRFDLNGEIILKKGASLPEELVKRAKGVM